jgi:hypothetical protein
MAVPREKADKWSVVHTIPGHLTKEYLRVTTPYCTSLDGTLFDEPRATFGTAAQKMPSSEKNSPKRCQSAGVQGDPSIATAAKAARNMLMNCIPQTAPHRLITVSYCAR